ncbi:hypothetical protein K435DRAFT_879980 [Dendrothele bispora CBS 962.96]|uniref:Uncharacterized protein n=1 Tax=Dendrothele bispora (strain CBS 962.96) TaxID=1314807 RepID=A0A4S8KK78_DENBC|nr:hypothetical protein K435DRAFT_879980 [Dendrothele bispora CBS 962.96]
MRLISACGRLCREFTFSDIGPGTPLSHLNGSPQHPSSIHDMFTLSVIMGLGTPAASQASCNSLPGPAHHVSSPGQQIWSDPDFSPDMITQRPGGLDLAAVYQHSARNPTPYSDISD